MGKDLGKFYSDDFYRMFVAGMSNSASVVLGLLYESYQPRSVIDVGCGQGAWLAAAESLGAITLKGIDGHWVRKEALLSDHIDFTAINFDEAFPKISEKYDLCISLEVAEHISGTRAKEFIDLLCSASDVILFGAAIKYQGGANHINEQPQSYWIDLFNRNGFQCLDVIRGRVWNNNDVEWWYKQNTFLFVGPRSTRIDLSSLKRLERPIYDIVHPMNYQGQVKQHRFPTFRFCLSCLKNYGKKTGRRLINKFKTAQ